jgi:hypothetical protein
MDRKSIRGVVALALFAACPTWSQRPDSFPDCDAEPILSFAEAVARAVERGALDIPPLARLAHPLGPLLVEVCVSESGAVKRARMKEENPVYADAAIRSAGAWRFGPGTPAAFKTVLEIAVPQYDDLPSVFQEPQPIPAAFQDAQDKCVGASYSPPYADAVRACLALVEIAEALPREYFGLREWAYGALGSAYSLARRHAYAAASYRRQLGLVLANPGAFTAGKLGSVRHSLARELHALGQVQEAAQNYAEAERELTTANSWNRYEDMLRLVRYGYLKLLEKSGQASEADALRRRMSAAPK